MNYDQLIPKLERLRQQAQYLADTSPQIAKGDINRIAFQIGDLIKKLGETSVQDWNN